MTMTWTLFGVDGTELPLTSVTAPAHLGTDPAGAFGLPPVEFSTPASPTLSAGSLRGEPRYRERLLALDLVIVRDTPAAVDAAIAMVAALLNPQHGDCRLVVTTDTDAYDLVVTYTGGWQPARATSTSRAVSARCTFRASDPWWRSLTVTEQLISFPVTDSGRVATNWSAPDVLMNDPTIPWTGFDAGADGSTIVRTSLTSTAPAWPRWRVAGPASRVELHNATTGVSFDWEGELDVDQVLTVGMAQDDCHVRVDGVDAWDGISNESRMWSLKPGRPGAPQSNLILVRLEGADSRTPPAVMTYQPAWQSPI